MPNFYAAFWSPYSTDPLAAGRPELEDNGTFIECVDVSSSFKFSTQLNGGFGAASFTVPGARDLSFQRMRRMQAAHVVVFDDSYWRVYEGCVTNVAIADYGVEVSLMGYYAKAADVLFSSEWQYEYLEHTHNLVPNPSFEANITDNWVLTTGTGGAGVRWTSDYYSGLACAKITQPSSGDTAAGLATTVTLAASTKYTFSVYIKNVDATSSPYLWVYENGSGGKTTQQTVYGLDAAWRRYSITFNTLADTNAASFGVYVPKPASTATQGSILIDAVQVEQLDYASGYCDGSLAGGIYHWDGTAHNSASYRDEYSHTTYEVLRDCIALVPYWARCSSMISLTDAYVYEQDFTYKKVRDAIESILAFGYSQADNAPMYFAIWNHRIPYVVREPYESGWAPDWLIASKMISGGKLGVNLTTDALYNKIYARYNGVDGPVLSEPAEDIISQAAYGVKEGVLNVGDLPTEDTSKPYFMAEAMLGRYKYPRQTFSAEIQGIIKHSSGTDAFPYRIRAGQQILFTDADFFTGLLDSISGPAAAGSIGFVLQTDYDASSNSTSASFGTSDQSYDVLLTRLGISGGLG